MFTIKANPTFPATLTIVGQGREQKLSLVYRHKSRDEHRDLLEAWREGKKDVTDVVLELVESWDADMELSNESVQMLHQEQPGADVAIIAGYSEAFGVSRKGN
jgi:hypothetical protein